MCTLDASARYVALWISCGILLCCAQALGQKYWVGPVGGLWSDPANWSATPGGPGGAGPPQVLEAAVAPSGISAHFDYVYGQPGIGLSNLTAPALIEQDVASSMLVGINTLQLPKFTNATSSGVGRYIQSAGTSILNESLLLGGMPLPGITLQGYYTLSGNTTLNVGSSLFANNGTFTQTGGLCSIGLGAELGDSFNIKPGGIDFSGGSLTMGFLTQKVGASTFSGGSATISGNLSFNANTSAVLSGGMLSVGSVHLGSAGGANSQMTQHGGVLNVSNTLNVGSRSTYRYNAGALTATTLNISGGVSGGGEFIMGPGPNKVARTQALSITENSTAWPLISEHPAARSGRRRTLTSTAWSTSRISTCWRGTSG